MYSKHFKSAESKRASVYACLKELRIIFMLLFDHS